MGIFKIFKQSDEERKNLVLNDSIMKTVMLLSAPVMFMLLAQSFVQVFDNWFVYNFSTQQNGAAVSYANTALQIAINGGIGLSVAGTALIGRLIGANDREKIGGYTQQFIFLMVITSAIVSVVTILITPFYVAQALPEIQAGVTTLMVLSPLTIPFQYFNTAYYAIKNANGKSEVQFMFTLLMLVLKVLANAIFIAVLGWGVTGVALANFAAQFLISIIICFDMFIRKGGMKVTFRKFQADWDILRDFLRVGIPSVVTNVTMSIGFMLINLESMKYGRQVLNTMGIANSITNVAYSTLNSFGTSITSMVSMNVGAKNYVRAKEIVRAVFKVITWTSLVVIAIMFLCSSFTSKLFVDDPELIGMITATQQITILGVHGFAMASVMCGVFVALGQTKIPLLIGGLRVIGFRYLFILAVSPIINHYLVIPYATLFSNTASLIIAYILYKKIDWEHPLETFHFRKRRIKK